MRTSARSSAPTKALRQAVFCLVMSCLVLPSANSQVNKINIGGPDGLGWEEQTRINLMVDPDSKPGAIQPLELDPDINVVTQLRHWMRYRQPTDIDYQVGMPRIWRAIGTVSRPGHVSNPMEFIDGDINTFYEGRDYGADGGLGGVWGEFYTLDMGLQIPADRFVLLPPEGSDPFLQEPYRPNYKFEAYDLTASNNPVFVNTQEPDEFIAGGGGGNPDYYIPLEIPLSSVRQNFDAVIDISFPLQYLRFFRMRLVPDNPLANRNGEFTRFALAELEIYGRGFVPQARWLSRVIDMGDLVNIGAVHFGHSSMRRNGDKLSETSGEHTSINIEIKTGVDDTPIAFHSFNDMAQLVEVTKDTYKKLKPRIWPWDPPAIGWQGLIVDDTHNWSFWSSPIRTSGQRPQVPKGRYIQLNIRLETEVLWDYARLDWLDIKTSPLLADRVVGEIASITEFQPDGGVTQVPAGRSSEFALDLRAEFSAASQTGFDAIRLEMPSSGAILGIEIGDPLTPVAPDSIIEEDRDIVIYLPQPLGPDADDRLRIRLETAVFRASDHLQAEVFNRHSDLLPQGVEGGDASEELGTNQLRILVEPGSLKSVISDVSVTPATFTPQGDGINEKVQIAYTLVSILNVVDVDIEIFNLSGQRVRHLESADQRAGRHVLPWDGRTELGRVVTPGVYLARIEAKTDRGIVTRYGSIAIAY